ncbi:MAG: Lrp/AsnC family transcriptional regulator [Acetivibrionales bacterium]|jgi:DNA-binding Lrp family transcriptional regulator|nr:Lrp/AsnC family transcriptional regulator [Clostridiaceae bacterium]
MKKELLDILKNNCRLSYEEIAVMLGTTADIVKDTIQELEGKGIIVAYNALIDWEKVDNQYVTAYIEVKVTPQRGQGFDKVAERIYQYPQVSACSLISGGFDLFVIVEGKTMKEVALFVAEKLAPVDSVLSCATHFVLRKYKDNGVIFDKVHKDDREAVVL